MDDPDILEILRLRAEGLSLAEIAGRLDLSRNAVAGKISRFKQKQQAARQPKPRRKRAPSFTDLDRRIVSLLKQGMTQRQVGRKLGISDAVMSRKVNAMRAAGEQGLQERARVEDYMNVSAWVPDRPKVKNPDVAFAQAIGGRRFRDAAVPEARGRRITSPGSVAARRYTSALVDADNI